MQPCKVGKGSQTVEKGNQFFASALGAQGKGDGGEASDGIQAEDDIVVLCLWSIRSRVEAKGRQGNGWQCVAYLELIDEDGDGIELIVRVRRVSHGEQCGRAGSWLGLSEEGAGRVWRAADGRREESLIACKASACG